MLHTRFTKISLSRQNKFEQIWAKSQALLTTVKSSGENNACQVRFTGIERKYWIGTEIGRLGGHGFRGTVTVGDESNQKGKIMLPLSQQPLICMIFTNADPRYAGRLGKTRAKNGENTFL